jgi:hypothetical protein
MSMSLSTDVLENPLDSSHSFKACLGCHSNRGKSTLRDASKNLPLLMFSSTIPTHIDICSVARSVDAREHIRSRVGNADPGVTISPVTGDHGIFSKLSSHNTGAIGIVLFNLGVGSVAHQDMVVGQGLNGSLGGGKDLVTRVVKEAEGSDRFSIQVDIHEDTFGVVSAILDVGVGVVKDADDQSALFLMLDACVVLVGEVDSVQGEVAAGLTLRQVC